MLQPVAKALAVDTITRNHGGYMLDKVSLFSELPPECIKLLEKTAVHRKYPKNTLLFLEGDESGQLFIIESGVVCVYTDDNEGRQLVLNYMGPGEYFGELSLIDNKPRSASVVTTEECHLLCISRESFRQMLKEHVELYDILICHLVERIRVLTGNVKDMALLDVYGRVAGTLERVCAHGQEPHPLKLTHQDIANVVGASREMVSRIMKELVVGGYIEIQQKHVRLLRPFPKHW